MPGTGLIVAGALLLALAAAAPAQVQLPAKPQTQSLDSEAPPGAPPHWLPAEEWVMQHWLPYDETRLYRVLGIDRGTVWRWLRDDTRNLAGLARERGWEPAELARRLVAPWRGRLREPRRLALLERRALRTLTQGHLAQHVFFHSLHQDAIPDNATAIFGVASREQFAALRRSELSPLQICRLNGLPRAHAERLARQTLRAAARRGVEGQAMPASQAQRLLHRQLRQVPRWLQQTRYNGPPPIKQPRASVATASNYSNNAVLSEDGLVLVHEGYEARLPLAKQKGEIAVLARTGSRPAVRVAAPSTASGARVPRSIYNPAVSSDGRWVAFESAEGNLNFAKRYGSMAVYVRDLRSSRAVRTRGVGRGSRSHYNPSISGDGGRVAFESSSSGGRTLAVVVEQVRGPRRVWTARPPVGQAHEPALSGDGEWLAFSAGGAVYVQDLRGGQVTRVSAPGVEAYEPVLSGDGSQLAYTAFAGDRAAVHVVDVEGGDDMEVPAPSRDAWTTEPSLSLDGRRVAFAARRPPDSRQTVWVFDRVTRSLDLVSRAGGAEGPPAAGSSTHPAISGDGRLVAFTSDAWNLSDGKCNSARGIFVRDLRNATTTLMSEGDGGNRYLGPTKGSSTAGDMFTALVCA